MNYSFEAIEKQAQETHSKAASLLQTKDSFWKQHKKSFGVVAFSAALIGFSVFAPQTSLFKAALIESGLAPQQENNTSIGDSSNLLGASTQSSPNTTQGDASQNSLLATSRMGDSSNIQTEASDISVDPVSPNNNSLSEETNVDALKNALTTNANTETVTDTQPSQEINPFDSVLKARENLQNTTTPNTSSEVPDISTEELHGAAPVIDDSQSVSTEALPASDISSDITAESIPFKENVHTTDVSSGVEESAPVLSEEETLHGVTSIVQKNDDSVFGTHRYTGIVLNKPAKKGFAFSYYLELENGTRLNFNTQRDLRNIQGKQVTIEVEGTKENFVFTHLYFDSKSQKHLPQSGPAEVLLFSGLIALAGGLFVKRKAF